MDNRPKSEDAFVKVFTTHAEFLQIIGGISVAFAEIEQYTAHIVCLCLGRLDWDRGLIVTDKMQYSATVELLKKLAPTTLPQVYAVEILEHVPFMEEAGRIRNRDLHATATHLLGVGGDIALDPIRYKYGKTDTRRKVTLTELRHDLLTLQKTGFWIQEMAGRLLAHFLDNE